MDDTVLFTDFGIVVFVIIASAIALMLSVLVLATTHRTRSIRRSGLSDIQDTIGQRLREKYAPERSTPTRLANLLREFEQRSNKSEAFTRDGYASAVDAV